MEARAACRTWGWGEGKGEQWYEGVEQFILTSQKFGGGGGINPRGGQMPPLKAALEAVCTFVGGSIGFR